MPISEVIYCEMEAQDVHRAWSLYYSEEGYPYFYNHVTNESYWAELPKPQSLSTGVEADDSWKTYGAADSLVSAVKNASYVSSSSSDISSSSSSESIESSSSNSSSDSNSDSGSDTTKENKRDFKAYLESTEGLDVVNDIEAHKDRVDELKLTAHQARISRLKKRKKRRNKRLYKDVNNKKDNNSIFSVISEYIQYFQGYISKAPNSANKPLSIEDDTVSKSMEIAQDGTREIDNETNNKETLITPIFQRCVPEAVTATLINNIIPAAIPVYNTVTSTIQNASNVLMKKAIESVTVIGYALWQSIEPTIVKLVENPECSTEVVEEASPTSDAIESIPTVVTELDFSTLPPAPPRPPIRSPNIAGISDDTMKLDSVDEIISGVMQEVVTNVITINSS